MMGPLLEPNSFSQEELFRSDFGDAALPVIPIINDPALFYPF